MSLDKKNLIGLFAGIIGIAAIKKATDKGSMAKIPKPKEGFSREQDLAYLRYKMNKPKFSGAAPDFSERQSKVSDFQSQMSSAQTNIADLQDAIAKQETEKIEQQLNQLNSDINDAKNDIQSLQVELDLTMKPKSQGGRKGESGIKAVRAQIQNKINALKANLVAFEKSLAENFEPLRFDASISSAQKAQAQSDLTGLKSRVSSIKSNISSLKAEMQAQKRTYEGRVGSDMTFEQYASEHYERPYSQMGGRYGAGGPAEKAWNQYSTKMGDYAGSEGSWTGESESGMMWMDEGAENSDDFKNRMKNYEEADSSWTGESENPFDIVDGFSKQLPKLPKFK